ncbi:MAG: methylated-DNA--[protein]-cysteine S-methyltransferase [Betaproteobacteria bacterium]|nr:methylated-DNA--[protein]-cysteine S-methyltransferase [Betaproteobacteria bacterium]
MVFSAVQTAPFGAVGVCTEHDSDTGLVFLDHGAPAMAPRDAPAREACRQLGTYFADPRHGFDRPLKVTGTAFQRRIWAAIASVPCGGTSTYGKLARLLESVPRAVGQACGANAYPLAIPCHRVVAASGLGGFAHHTGGYLTGIKRWLLRHEAAFTH